MARKSKMSMMKRQRERKKAEKAAAKREQRLQREEPEDGSGNQVADRDDLEGYGVVLESDEDEPED
jgi:hypothetical protein